jgi:hypothetical protein
MQEIRTSGSMSGDGKRSVAAWPKLPRPSSTLPSRRFVVTTVNSVAIGGIADLSERLVQTNSVENNPSATLAVHCGNGLQPISASIKTLV